MLGSSVAGGLEGVVKVLEILKDPEKVRKHLEDVRAAERGLSQATLDSKKELKAIAEALSDREAACVRNEKALADRETKVGQREYVAEQKIREAATRNETTEKRGKELEAEAAERDRVFDEKVREQNNQLAERGRELEAEAERLMAYDRAIQQREIDAANLKAHAEAIKKEYEDRLGKLKEIIR